MYDKILHKNTHDGSYTEQKESEFQMQQVKLLVWKKIQVRYSMIILV